MAGSQDGVVRGASSAWISPVSRVSGSSSRTLLFVLPSVGKGIREPLTDRRRRPDDTPRLISQRQAEQPQPEPLLSVFQLRRRRSESRCH